MTTLCPHIDNCIKRIARCDLTLTEINLNRNQLADSTFDELADCLLAHPDVVAHVYLGYIGLTDKTGIKLARYVASSSTIKTLYLPHNQFGEATYLALAAALRVNTSIRYLYLYNNQAVDRTHIDSAFVEALRLNPDRPAESLWRLYSLYADDNFQRLNDEAKQLGHPTLQMILNHELEKNEIKKVKHTL